MGPVFRTEYVELQAKSNGRKRSLNVGDQLGAVVQGRLVHQEEGKSAKVMAIQAASAGLESAAMTPHAGADNAS